MPILVINKTGETHPKVEQYASEEILYTLDCQSLLDHNELIKEVQTPPPSSLIYEGIRPRKGTNIEVRITSKSIGAPYIETRVPITFTTTRDNTRIALFQIKVYK